MGLLPIEAFVCGVARQCASDLSATLARVDELRQCFAESDVVLVTNNSTDGTATKLSQWSAATARAHVIYIDGLAGVMASRTDRLAMARNLYLYELWRAIESGRQYGVVVVVDLDGVNSGLITGRTFSEAVHAAPKDWGALFGNQRQAYYDIWALRHRKWCPGDCWADVARASRYFPRLLRDAAHARSIKRFVGERQVHIPAHSDPISVNSAFGGIAIYKTEVLSGVWYSGRDKHGLESCEHVGFNLRLREAGAKLYILPSLLNDAPFEHLAPGAGSLSRPWL